MVGWQQVAGSMMRLFVDAPFLGKIELLTNCQSDRLCSAAVSFFFPDKTVEKSVAKHWNVPNTETVTIVALFWIFVLFFLCGTMWAASC